jgi:hypothetical protein
MAAGGWNQVQGALFRLAYKRAQRAIEAGFYLEAVALCESLILNRIEVVLRHSAGVEYDKFSVGKALSNVETHKVPVFDKELLAETKIWVKGRNYLSHHFAQVDTELALSWRGRLAMASDSATRGLSLANRWSKESRKHKF